MKRATLLHVKARTHATYTSERNIYTDILDSDARQRAEIRTLKAQLADREKRLARIAVAYPNSFSSSRADDDINAALDLSIKNWTKKP